MELGTIGIASAAAIGASAASRVAGQAIDFAQVFAAKFQSTTPTSTLPKPPFDEALDQFDSLLRSLGLDPSETRSINSSSDQPEVIVNTNQLSAWDQEQIASWIDQHQASYQMMKLNFVAM
jgi:hypothetical protein